MNVYGGKLVMLSNKMTFSLTSLVMLLAIGLVFTPVTMAVDPVGAEPIPVLNTIDVSAAAGAQVEIFEAYTS